MVIKRTGKVNLLLQFLKLAQDDLSHQDITWSPNQTTFVMCLLLELYCSKKLDPK
jgi:hypothetical protein